MSSTFDVLNIDFIGPFPDGTHVLVIIDSFSRWTELFHCKDSTEEPACRCLLEHFCRFGSPNLIRSDRGPHFANELIEKFSLAVGTLHNLTLTYSKEENSIVKRVNKEVNRHLRSFVFETLKIDQYKLCLPFVQRIMNSSIHGCTGVSRGHLLFGNRLDLNRGILTPFQQALPSKTSGSRIMADMINAQDTADRTVQEMVQENAAQRLTDQLDPTVFPIESYVLAQYVTGPPTRLHTRWQGPMEVISHGDSEYVLLNIVLKKTKRIHASKLKIFLFDPAKIEAMDSAHRDYMEFYFEAITAHKGNI